MNTKIIFQYLALSLVSLSLVETVPVRSRPVRSSRPKTQPAGLAKKSTPPSFPSSGSVPISQPNGALPKTAPLGGTTGKPTISGSKPPGMSGSSLPISGGSSIGKVGAPIPGVSSLGGASLPGPPTGRSTPAASGPSLSPGSTGSKWNTALHGVQSGGTAPIAPPGSLGTSGVTGGVSGSAINPLSTSNSPPSIGSKWNRALNGATGNGATGGPSTSGSSGITGGSTTGSVSSTSPSVSGSPGLSGITGGATTGSVSSISPPVSVSPGSRWRTATGGVTGGTSGSAAAGLAAPSTPGATGPVSDNWKNTLNGVSGTGATPATTGSTIGGTNPLERSNSGISSGLDSVDTEAAPAQPVGGQFARGARTAAVMGGLAGAVTADGAALPHVAQVVAAANGNMGYPPYGMNGGMNGGMGGYPSDTYGMTGGAASSGSEYPAMAPLDGGFSTPAATMGTNSMSIDSTMGGYSDMGTSAATAPDYAAAGTMDPSLSQYGSTQETLQQPQVSADPYAAQSQVIDPNAEMSGVDPYGGMGESAGQTIDPSLAYSTGGSFDPTSMPTY